MKKIVKGNDFTLRIPVMKMVDGQAQAFPLPACTDVVVQVCNQFRRIPLAFTIDVKDDNVLLARVEGDKMSLGTYAIEVKGKIFGNDWRSNEYPQFSIVAKNADSDTEFGTTDEGDNSVEMDTAMVILPPTVELSDLINKANDALKTNKETNDTINANESARQEAEAQRVTAESERVKAEQTRVSAEETRVSAEGDRANAERGRELAEFNRIEAERVRVENENTILANERTRNDNEQERVYAESLREHAEEERVTAENIRANSELQRVTAENERESAENGRSSSEEERVQAEKKRQTDTSSAIGSMTERINTAIDEFNAHRTEFDEAEAQRVDAENSRVEAETARANAEKSRVTSENERVSAETERTEAESNRQTASAKAVKAANDAAAQANATNESIKTNEQGRVDAETNRKSAEKSRNDNEGIRQESETERISQETERQTNERKRVEAENKRIKAEADRVSAEGARAKSEQARVDAETKRERDFDTAIQAAETATLGAEKVDATLTEENVFEVTGRTGVKKTLDMSGLVHAQSDVARIQESMGTYSDRPNIMLTAKENNVAISADGVKVAKTGWAIAEFTAELGNIYLFNPGETSSDVCVFAEYIDKVETRAIDYAYTYDESGRVLTAKATYNGKTYTYTYDYSSSITSITDQDGNNVSSLPSVYTTTVGTYQPMTILNANAELPEDGYCRFVSNFTTASAIKIVASYKVSSADMTMKVVRDGSTANMCTQLAKINKKVDVVSARIPDMWVDICATKRVAVTIDNKLIWLNPGVNYRFENVKSISFGKNGSALLDYVKRVAFHYNKMVEMINFQNFSIFSSDTGTMVQSSLRNLTELDVSGWDISNFKFSRNFTGLYKIKKLDVASWNTSNAISFWNLFTNDSALEELDVSAWDTSNVTNMNSTFKNCGSLKELDVSGWDTSNVTNMDGTFWLCGALVLDVSNWDTSKCTSLERTFCNTMITKLDLSNWNTSNVSSVKEFLVRAINIKTLTFGENFGRMKDECSTLDLSSLLNWKDDSVKTLLSLYDRKANGMGAITIKLHANAKAVLGEDGIAQLTAKGYIIV